MCQISFVHVNRATDLDHKQNISDRVISGVGRKQKCSDSSDSNSVSLLTLIMTPIFYFHQVISTLMTLLITPTPIPSLVKTSLNCHPRKWSVPLSRWGRLPETLTTRHWKNFGLLQSWQLMGGGFHMEIFLYFKIMMKEASWKCY